MIRMLWLVLAMGCSEPSVRDRVAGALELGAVGLEVAATEVAPTPCAALLGGATALRGSAVGVRSRSLPELAVDVRRCGEVDAAAVSCEVRAWAPATVAWLGGVAGAVVDAAVDPSSPHVAPAVAVGRCP